jgi:ER-Golgi trafficking TRAPP I complex 85 kDa subunit
MQSVADGRSNVILEKMKRSLGLHCTILRLNTGSAENNIPLHKSLWVSAGEELSSLANPVDVPSITNADKEALQKLVRDMVTQSMVPHMERCITMWNDQVIPSRFSTDWADSVVSSRAGGKSIHCITSTIQRLEFKKRDTNHRFRKL